MMKKLKLHIKNTRFTLAILLFVLISYNVQAQTTCSGTANIPVSGSTTINGVTITPSFTGSVSTYGNNFTSCSTYTTTAGSMWVGSTGVWSVTLNFNKPVNNLLFVLTATGHNGNENFIFNSNGGTVTITDQGSCFSSISGNTLLSGLGASAAGGGGGYFTISAPSPYTKLVINGAGGHSGSLLAICQASILACSAGNTAPTIGSNKIANSCPATTGDLTTLVTSTAPSGTSITYHTGSPATSANKISDPTTAPVGTYYAAYWDATNNCYSPVSEPIYVAMCLTNTCPSTTVDLTTHSTGTTPSGTTLQWHTSSTPSSGTLVSNPNAVGNGTYYATYYDATNNFYSPISTPIRVTISTCSAACYKPAQTTGTTLDTNHGITALGRAGADNGNWPMARKGAWTVLEAKTKGFVVNRLTDAQINAIPSADLREGMMVYNITQDCLQINIDGTATGWRCFNTQTCPD